MGFIADEEFQHLSLASILKHSIAIPKSSPKTFFFITLSFIFPLSLTILGNVYLLGYLADNSLDPSSLAKSQYFNYILIHFKEFIYLLFVCAFSLLSTSTSVLTVASLYTTNTATFSSTIYAIPPVFPRLFITFLWFALLALMYNAIFYIYIPVILIILSESWSIALRIVVFFPLLFIFLMVQVYVMSMWKLASVVSVVEPIYGLAAMKKSRELLQGKTLYASILVLGYMLLCAVILLVFYMVPAYGGAHGIGLWVRIFVGVVLVGGLVGLILVGFMAQNIFYYVCKSSHHESIDKSAVANLLEGYVKVHEKVNSMT